MKAYRVSVNLKLGLISFAVVIAVASLWYTKNLVDQLKERESSVVQLWAKALEEVPKAQQQAADNTFPTEFQELENLVVSWRTALSGDFDDLSEQDYERYRDALSWARSAPVNSDLTFILETILRPTELFGGIPAILVDSTSGPTDWRNIDVEQAGYADLSEVDQAKILAQIDEMAAIRDPIPIVVEFTDPSFRFVRYVYYGESDLVERLRWFPYIQLFFVALFVVVGYLGFSYVRKSEQSSLWVGMAKEAAHQLGTPISSLMGWVEFLRMNEEGKPSDSNGNEQTYKEIEKDIARLGRVTSRFSDIGSLPKLERQPVQPVLESVTEYMRRRIPQKGTFIRLNVVADPDLKAPLNADLFEWVVENLLKNALDAMESERGRIDVLASAENSLIRIDVRDTGKGIDRRQWKNVFRPGYSTKKRGWGLGLSLAKRIVEDYHGGSLTLASSRLGQGTTFRIEIPSS